MDIRFACALTMASLGAVVLTAQQAPVAPDQRPPVTFRSEINFVEIDAVVTDRAGRFVADLTKDDFQIIEEGQPQALAAFSLVQIPVERRLAETSTSQASLEPDAVTNRRPLEGRIFLLLLDDLQTDLSRTHFVRTAAREFVERHVGVNDQVAVAFTSGRSLGQDFTSSRQRLLAAVDRFAGMKLKSKTAAQIEAEALRTYEMKLKPNPPPPRDPYEGERIQRARASLEVLERLSEYLGGIRGRRKALVYLGEGIDSELIDVINPDEMPTGDAAGVRTAIRDAVAAATRANVTVYTIDPRGLSTGLEDAIALPTIPAIPTSPLNPMRMVDGMSRSHLWLRSISEDTNGVAFLNTNDMPAVMSRVVEDSSSYYILGYYAPAGRKDGRFRNVDVRVRRPGLQVRARKGYYAPHTATPARSTTDTATKASKELLEALRSPLPVHGLSMSASAIPFQGNARTASVLVVVELDPSGLRFTELGNVKLTDIELLIAASDPQSRGTKEHRTHHVAELRLRPETLQQVATEGVRIMRRIDLAAGRYRLQVGGRDRTGGAVGTVFADLDVPDLHGPPLAMSGVVLVSAAATRAPTIGTDAALSALLPGAPTSRREFPANDTLAVFAEIYDNDLTRPHRVRVVTSVLTPEGHEVFSARSEHTTEELTAAAARATGGGFGHRVTIPAPSLGPGQFILRVQAERSIDTQPVVRELPFTIR